MTDVGKWSRVVGLALGIGAFALLAEGEPGGWPESHPPADSSMWWTLTDSVLPEDLRASLLNPEEHRKYYLEAVEAGSVEPLPPGQLSRLKYFVEGSLTPERFRACEIFDSFVVGRLRNDRLSELSRLALSETYSLSEEGVAIIFLTTKDTKREREEGIAAISPKQSAFIEVLKSAKEALSREDYRRAYESRDLSAIAAASGHDIAPVQELAEAWERDVTLEISAAGLEVLQATLSAADWQNFRRFLLEEIAAFTSTIEFEEEP